MVCYVTPFKENRFPYQIIRLYRHYYTPIFPRNKRFRCRRRQWMMLLILLQLTPAT